MTRKRRSFTPSFKASIALEAVRETKTIAEIAQSLRREVKMFPEIAVRELVANALIHQDFTETGMSVMVEIYDHRMEISNPGKPFISPDRFIDEYQTRNERPADLMRRLGICDEKGSGVDKVIQAAEAFQLPAPDFRVGEKRTSVVLFGHKEFEAKDRNDRIRATCQHSCLRYVMNERMTNQSLRERFRLPEKKSESVSRAIRDTVEAGKIKQADPEQTSLRYRHYVPFWACFSFRRIPPVSITLNESIVEDASLEWLVG